MNQVRNGVQAFSSALCDCEEMETFRNAITVDLGQSIHINGNEEGDTDEDVENDDEDDEDNADDDDDNIGGVEGDKELDSIFQVCDEEPQCSANSVFSVSIDTNISCWRFPEGITQGNLNGRNGSNACSIIALMIAHIIQRSNFPIPIPGPALPITWIKLLCTAIEMGNRMYDNCRHSLPSRFLSVEEAVEILQSCYNVVVDEPLPVRLQDEHSLSTVHSQLAAGAASGAQLALFIINEKTSLFVISSTTVVYIDTHVHNPDGAIIIQGTTNNLQQFCNSIWSIEHNSEDTYGNLVFVNFLS